MRTSEYSIPAPGYAPVSGVGAAIPGMQAIAIAALVTGLAVAASWPTAVTVARAAKPVTAPFPASFGPLPSHSGMFRGAVVSYPSALDAGTWVVRLERRSGRRVAHARVTAVAYMPETGERLAQSPRVTRYLGDGRYRIEGLSFPRAGWWNVSLTLQYRGVSDSLAFNLVVPATGDSSGMMAHFDVIA